MSVEIAKIERLNLSHLDVSDKLDLIKNTVCKGASDDELDLFLYVCRRTGLDPLMKQIYSIPRGKNRTIQAGIDGLRLVAERTGKYAPGRKPEYEYDENKRLISSTAYIKKMTADGTWHEVSATCYFTEYNPGNNPLWQKMPHVMLAKCSEAAALRKAFPAELSGIYSDDEMAQATKELEMTKVEEIHFDETEIKTKFLNQYEGALHDDISAFLDKLATHYNKSVAKVIYENYKDKDKFEKHFSEWLSRPADKR